MSPENEVPKCAAGVSCPGASVIDSEMRLMNRRLMIVDLIREIIRNLIGLIVVPGILLMLYSFVSMTPEEDRLNIMLLVIGYLGGLATGVTTWYFGTGMKSAVQTALQTAKGGIGSEEIKSPPPQAPGSVLFTAPVDSIVGGVRGPGNDTGDGPANGKPENPNVEDTDDRQAGVRRSIPKLGTSGQPGETVAHGEVESNPVG